LEQALASNLKSRISFAGEARLVRILVGITTVGGIAAVVKIISVVKGSVIARHFGLSDNLDAFYVAYLLPSFICDLFAGATLITLVPLYIQVSEHDGREAAQKFFAGVTACAAVILTAVSVLLWVVLPYFIPLLGKSFNPAQILLTRSFIPYLIPLIPLSGLSAIFTAVLTAKDRLALATLTPVISAVAVIVTVYGLAERWGTYAIAVGMTCGLVGQVVILIIGLRYWGLWSTPSWYGLRPPVRSFLRQLVTVAAGAVIINLMDVIDQYSAAAIGPGSVSALNYGNKLVPMTVGLASLALTTAVLPHFSALISGNDFVTVKHIVKTYSILILLVTIPVTLLLIFVSPSIVRVLFEGGAFTPHDTLQVAAIQRFFLLQVPLHVLGMLFVSLLWALRANWIFLLINPVCLLLKFILNDVLISIYGVVGIGLATSITYSMSCLLLLLALTLLINKKSRGVNYLVTGA
jgi:putative peptidoglycan lipid II flippase